MRNTLSPAQKLTIMKFTGDYFIKILVNINLMESQLGTLDEGSHN